MRPGHQGLLGKQFEHTRFVDPRKVLQLDRIEPTFARFDLGREALRPAQDSRDLLLSEPGAKSCRPEIREHFPIPG